MKRKKLYLIDGSSYIYRAFHALPHFSNDKGVPTNATYGFTQMLLKLIKVHEPDHIAVVFDAKGPTFRHELYPDYKATRAAMPDELRPQLPYIRDVVRAYGIPLLEMEGYEADDIIGTLVQKFGRKSIDLVMVTGDKDMMQLVDESTSMLDTMKEKSYGVDEVKARFGVEPRRVVEVMALTGDSSDNIPGVPGIGEKGAAKLMKEFATIDELYANLDKVAGKAMKEKLVNGEELARLSRKLAEIDTGVPVECTLEELALSEPDRSRLQEIFRELGFTKLLKELTGDAGSRRKRPAETLQKLIDGESIDRLLSALASADAAALSLFEHEGTSEAAAFALAITPVTAGEKEHGLCFFFSSRDGAHEPDALPDGLKNLLADDEIKKLTSNGKALTLSLARRGVTLGGISMDTSVASYLLNPSTSDHSLKAVAARHLETGLAAREEIISTDEEALQSLLCEETEDIGLLASRLDDELGEAGLTALFSEVELPLIPILAAMERHGIMVRRETLTALSLELATLLADLEKSIFTVAGTEFNINSSKQLAEILFEKIGLKPVRKTKTGLSTDEKVLKTLAKTHELPKLILEFRHLAKLKSTYVDALIGLIDPVTCRIHTSFNQTVTATGRLSSSKPNLQNIPIKTKFGERIRDAFVAEEGHLFLSADYSQIELRLVAHLSGDEILIDAFNKGEDIHQRTASEVFGIMPGLVTGEMRRRAKAINFGIIYGMGPHGLAGELEVSQKEAKEYIESYFSRYRGVKDFIDTTIREAAEKGYTTSLFGRKRFIPELMSGIDSVRRFGERIAINTPIQGTAADIIKIAMIRIAGKLKGRLKSSRMLLQIHDELLFEVPRDDVDAVREIVVGEMEGVVALEVPTLVNVTTGQSWLKSV